MYHITQRRGQEVAKGEDISHLSRQAAHKALSSSSKGSREEPWPCGAAGNAEVEAHHPPFLSTCPASLRAADLNLYTALFALSLQTSTVHPRVHLPFFPHDINPIKVIILLSQLCLAHTPRSSVLLIQTATKHLCLDFFSTTKFLHFFPELL